MKSLIVIEARDASRTEDLSPALHFLDDNFELLSMSSIYELAYDQENADKSHKLRYVNSKALVIAASVESEIGSMDMLEKIDKWQKGENKKLTHNSIHLYLVFRGQETSMLPSLFLPHPSLNERKDWMLAAAEIWPNFEHPILEESLDYICRKKKLQSSDYFFAQGKSLLTLNFKDK